MTRLRRGDLLPRVLQPPPGPRARRLGTRLARFEAPGINTLSADGVSLLWEEACGANVLDVDGNRYIDLTSGFGVAAVGHRHPRVVAAVRRQAGRLLHGLADVHAHPLRPRLARRLVRRAPVEDGRVYFAVSGSDAVEVALKTALLATGRAGILAFEPAYHGLTLGSLQASSRAAFRQPFAAHFHPGVHRLPFACPPDAVDRLLAREPEIGCVILEPVVGREGVLPPAAGWLPEIRRIALRHGVLLIADEIFTGFGRCGSWFAVDPEGVSPDLLCCGKALGGGLPLAAVIGERRWMSCWESDGEARHTGTFVANPLACAAGLAVLDVLSSHRLPQRATRLGARIAERLADWPERFEQVVACRGRGLLWGIELVAATCARRLVADLRRRGVLLLAGGPGGRVLQIVPPLVVTASQLELSLDLIESLLAEPSNQ